jgi:hypothetical protein
MCVRACAHMRARMLQVDPVPGFTFKLYDGEHLREQFAEGSMCVAGPPARTHSPSPDLTQKQHFALPHQRMVHAGVSTNV